MIKEINNYVHKVHELNNKAMFEESFTGEDYARIDDELRNEFERLSNKYGIDCLLKEMGF